MCFAEFIGYTCGHTSREVLRVCPMTAHCHQSPVCRFRGRRPVLVPEMCPACQRIIHGRAVLSLEWEHHWMHERNVCGCPVEFPDLIKPRFAGGGRREREHGPSWKELADDGKMDGLGGKEAAAPALDTLLGAGSYASAPGAKAGESGRAVGAEKQPAVYRETTRYDGGSQNLGVSVRIPSLYAAEWVDEHRQLHIQGVCHCPGDFGTYETPEAYGDVSSLPLYAGLQPNAQTADCHIMGRSPQALETAFSPQTQPASGFPPVHSQQGAWNPNQVHSNAPLHQLQTSTQPGNLYQGIGPPGFAGVQQQQQQQQQHLEPVHYGQQAFQQDQQYWSEQHERQSQSQHQDQQGGYQSAVPLNPANTSGYEYQQHAPYYQELPTPANYGHPVRAPGAIWEVDLSKSTNPLYNFACGEGAKLGKYVDFQTVEYPEAAQHGHHPLVGLPLGAGPEAPALFCHTRDFDDCALRVKNICDRKDRAVLASLIDESEGRCRLGRGLAKAKSTSLLRDLDRPQMVLGERQHRGWWSEAGSQCSEDDTLSELED